MRVISGKYKGKKIEGYDIEGTRPTQDRVKESMFAMIQNDIQEAVVLDLFAGSGNLGIEAFSNGASIIYFVDKNSKCIEILNKNLKELDTNKMKVYHKDYQEALAYFMEHGLQFDIIFLDPPYHLECLDSILKNIIEWNLLISKGIIVCEYETDQFQQDYSNLELIKEKKYGYKNIRIYKNRK